MRDAALGDDDTLEGHRRIRQSEGTLDEVLARVASGDRIAFEEVYRRSSAKLFGVCLRILRDRSEAEDALQSAYLSVWRNAAQFDGKRGRPMTWLIVLARNQAIDRLRTGKTLVNSPIDLAADVSDPVPIASQLPETASENRRLHDCLTLLDATDAEFIRTAFFEGSTYAELAARAAMPLGTLKSRVRRALLKLRECLA